MLVNAIVFLDNILLILDSTHQGINGNRSNEILQITSPKFILVLSMLLLIIKSNKKDVITLLDQRLFPLTTFHNAVALLKLFIKRDNFIQTDHQ